MSLTALLTQHFTLKHPVAGAADEYGNPENTYPDPGDDVYGYLEPQSETEQLVEAQTYRTTFRLFLEAAAPITAQDIVEGDDGRRFEVLEVLPFFNPRRAEPSHIECRVQQVVG